jgi:hypothetical protein
LAITLAGILILSFLSACSSPPQLKSITCDQMISIDLSQPGPHWSGPLTGCELEGTVEYRGTPSTYKEGKIEHFFENFKITTKGGIIIGSDKGDWDLTTFKFTADGVVKDATGDWAYLKGYQFHETGTTTQFPPPEGTTVINGPSTMSLTAP